MLDSTNNSMLKNQTSKSVILAPFNSTKSNIGNDTPALTESMKALLQSKRVIKFAARVREIDKQYEINNNAELDNGVYHKLEEEEAKENEIANKNKPLHQAGEDSLQSSFNKTSSMKSDDNEESLRIKEHKKKKSHKENQTELEKLESLIYQQEDDIDNPYIMGNKEKADHAKVNKDAKRSPRVI